MRFISSWATIILISAIFTLFSLAAIAQVDVGGFPIPDADIAKLLLELGTNYKTLGFAGILAIATLLTVQAIKAWVDDKWKFKRLLTLGVSIFYSVIAGLIIPGSNPASVIVTVFISSGGAVALYEALKGAGIIKSKSAVAVK